MAGVTKKFSLNFKKSTKKRTGEHRDELDLPTSHVRSLSPSLSSSHHAGRRSAGGKSSSCGSIHGAMDMEMDGDDILQLTQNVRVMFESLQVLKQRVVVTEGAAYSDNPKYSALDQLADVLAILQSVLTKFPVLQSTDVLSAAAVLITRIKSYNYEEGGCDGTSLLTFVDQLSLAFSNSVQDFMMGNPENYPRLGKSKSVDNLAVAAADGDAGEEEKVNELCLTPKEMDERLHKSDGGMEIAFERAKAWGKYAKDIITYVEKRAHLESEFSKGLTKLAHSVKQSIVDDNFMPFQSIYVTALDQDIDFATNTQATCSLLTGCKFIEPLRNRRLEHENMRKNLRDQWTKETKKMQESVTNMKKAKTAYISRRQDHEKSKDSTCKAENENLNQSTGSTQTKLDKKKKQEEDAHFRSKEAEITYQTCVLEANNSRAVLERVKGEILAQIRELIYHSDQIMQAVTSSYFQMQYSVSAAPPVQFQVLADLSSDQTPGGRYMEYIRRLHVPNYTEPEPFIFQPYNTEQRSDGAGRKPSTHSSGSGSDVLYGDDSPHLSPRHKDDQEDSVSGSSCKSSPSASPYPNHRSLMANSNSSPSMSEFLASADDRFLGALGLQGVSVQQFRGVQLSRAAQTHVFRKLRISSRCRQCEAYVYFGSVECEKCGMTCHKKCLENLQWECGSNKGAASGRRMTTFGVDFSAHVQEHHTQIPHLVRTCIARMDEEDYITIKGIYRLSTTKSKVEKLCQNFETDPTTVDLSDTNAHTVTNVLKLYLRELPEPLLTFRLYPQLIDYAKNAKETKGDAENYAAFVPGLKAMIHKLPAPNLRTLSLLMHHLHRVTQHEDENCMTPYNLAIIFGPNLLKPPNDGDSTSVTTALAHMPHGALIVEMLIHYAPMIFDDPDLSSAAGSPAAASKRGGSSSSAGASGGGGQQHHLRLGVVAEASAMPDEDEDDDKWYAPETENLLDELVKEEPRFQQMEDMSTPSEQPAVSGAPHSQPQQQQQQLGSTSSLPPTEDNEDEDDDGDWELEESLLPDKSDSVNTTASPSASSLKLPTTPTSSGNIGSTASPGLRRKILPSQLLPKASTPIQLTKPLAFTPSSQQPKRPNSTSSASSSASSVGRPTTPPPQALVTSAAPAVTLSSLSPLSSSMFVSTTTGASAQAAAVSPCVSPKDSPKTSPRTSKPEPSPRVEPEESRSVSQNREPRFV